METQQCVIDWLLESDSAIRWQVMKDILHKPPAVYEAERSRLTQEGWCTRLLQYQDADGLWNHSLYNGKWISTTYSLYLLKLLGLPSVNPQSSKGCDQLLSQGLFQGREIRFSRDQSIPDLGVTALVLSQYCYFGYEASAIHQVTDFLANQQVKEGNWLPNEAPSAAYYTFETTLLVLEALLQYGNRYAAKENQVISKAAQNGQEFLLKHHLGLERGKPIKGKRTSFSFPSYWFYDVLTALDYFYAYGRNKDERLQPAIDLLRARQTADGRWLLGSRHPGRTYFDMEEVGKPSRWNTLRALRVLAWWDGS
jgi:hypothetical protein